MRVISSRGRILDERAHLVAVLIPAGRTAGASGVCRIRLEERRRIKRKCSPEIRKAMQEGRSINPLMLKAAKSSLTILI